jgi:hypothetical protein
MNIEKQIKRDFAIDLIIFIVVFAAISVGTVKCASWLMSGDTAKDICSQVKDFKEASE